MFKYVDYFEKYGRIMQFNKNKKEPFHRWYPFVEGYSKEFIKSILDEMNNKKVVCMEPFSGSGTTSLELQNNGIKCYSFEVNPLMFLIAKVKLENKYELKQIDYWLDNIKKSRDIINVRLKTEFPTLYENPKRKKWNYNTTVALAVEKLKKAIECIEEEKYRDLFMVALASILLDVSNLYRNGKCLSYKKGWESRKLTEKEVFEKFDKKVLEEIRYDIENVKRQKLVCNKRRLYLADSRVAIDKNVEDESIDLIITSPPYLNSRDYTDTYMLELKTLGFTKDFNEINTLREQTLRSHVQIKWKDVSSIDNNLLKETIEKLEEASVELEIWNSSIIDMVRLYFVDMKRLFSVIYKKMKKQGRVYFNVSNSAYFNVLINTLEICASIAEQEGFNVVEIRKARYLNPSPQQKDAVGQLLEGVIVLEKVEE